MDTTKIECGYKNYLMKCVYDALKIPGLKIDCKLCEFAIYKEEDKDVKS